MFAVALGIAAMICLMCAYWAGSGALHILRSGRAWADAGSLAVLVASVVVLAALGVRLILWCATVDRALRVTPRMRREHARRNRGSRR